MSVDTSNASDSTVPLNARPWVRRLARLGYLSRGVVYLIIGFFAVLSGIGSGENQGTRDALHTVLEQPFGRFLVGLLIIGLIGYVLWRAIQSLLDTDDHGWSARGLAVRAGLLASATSYALLTTYALSLVGLLAFAGSDDSPSVAERIAGLVGTRAVLVVMILVFIGVGLAHWYKAFTRGYAKHFDTRRAPMQVVHPVSMIGLIARGSVFFTFASLLVDRVLNYPSGNSNPPGLEAALSFIQQLPLGGMLLLMLGCGLMLFAGYSFSQALWRDINVEDAEADLT